MKPTERVILVKGDSSKWYNQAIFIVNKDTPATKMPVDFVAEAEKIIYNHMAAQKKSAKTKEAAVPAVYTSHVQKFSQHVPSGIVPARSAKKTSAFDLALNLMMILACVAIIAVFAYGMMS
jgi:hypothetical protein